MASNPLPKIGWDTVVVIDFLDQKPNRLQFITPIVRDAEAKKLLIVVSMLAIVETTHLTSQPPADQAKIISDFFERECVRREAAGLFVCERARDIRRLFPVDGADSVHLATAVETNTPVFLTNDGESKRKKKPMLPLDGKIMLADGKTPLRIMTPEDYDKMLKLASMPLQAAAASPIQPAPPATGGANAP